MQSYYRTPTVALNCRLFEKGNSDFPLVYRSVLINVQQQGKLNQR